MKNITIAIIIVIIFVAGGVYIFVNKDKIFGPVTGSTIMGPQTYNIEIKNKAFVPNTLNIKVGDKVVWINKDETATHIVLSDKQPWELSSRTLLSEDSYSHTFNKSGEYNYHCEVHYTMKGRVVVS